MRHNAFVGSLSTNETEPTFPSTEFPPTFNQDAVISNLAGNGTAPGTLQELGDFLSTGYWAASGRSASSYNLGSTGVNAKFGVLQFNVSGFSDQLGVTDTNGIGEARKELVREAFNIYEEVLGINFVETSSQTAEFYFSDNQSGAYASSTGRSSNFSHSLINISASWSGGTSTYDDYTLQTILHEIGHALGLGHQGLYNGSGTYATDADFANDSWQASMMSYFSQTENTYVDGDYEFLQTPMAADWIALQDIYGGQSYGGQTFGTQNAFEGDTVYGFNTNISSAVSDIWASFSSYAQRSASTIIDAGGIDTLDLSGYSANQRIDLTVTSTGAFTPTLLDVGGRNGNLTLAAGTVIENAIGGAGNDTFIGNGAANIFRGNGGDDVFADSSGNDTYFGGTGTDRVDFISSFASYSFEITGNFLSVIQVAVDTAIDLVENSVEWLNFAGETFGFNDIFSSFLPLPSTTITAAFDNSGSIAGAFASGGATDDASPTLSGTLDQELSAGETVAVFRDGVKIGDATTTGLNWSFSDSDLDDGTFAYTAATTSATKTGDVSAAFILTIDTTAPTLAVAQLTTTDSTPSLGGTIDDEEATVTVNIAGLDYDAINNGDGTWTLENDTIAPLTAGSYDVSVAAVDAVGNSINVVSSSALTIQDVPIDPPPGEAILEFGSTTLAQAGPNAWTFVNFTETIQDAIVALGPVSSNGGDPIAPRIRNVTDSGFEIQFQEYSYHNSFHMAETVSWVAVAAGVHDIGGLTVQAGQTTSSTNESWVQESYSSDFSDTPVVFAQVASDNETDAVVTRIKGANADSFQFQLQEEEASNNLHTNETVHWIAFEQGDGAAFDVTRTADLVTHNAFSVGFDPISQDDAVFLGQMQTRDGGDTANLRLRRLDEDSATFFIEEEKSLDDEINHATEIVGFLTAEESVWIA